jgi:predicted RNA binding protein with dsRBD fold (UPF0201 family)
MSKVTFLPITFNTRFKTKREAKQTAIKSVMGFLRNDTLFLGAIEVEVSKKPCKNCPVKENK